GCVIAAICRDLLGRPDVETVLEQAEALVPGSSYWPLARRTRASLAAARGDEDGVRAALADDQPSIETEAMGARATTRPPGADSPDGLADTLAAWDRALAVPYQHTPLQLALRRLCHLNRALTLVGLHRVEEAEDAFESAQQELTAPDAWPFAL